MIHPDRNILTAALLLHAIATDVEKARRHLTTELRNQDGIGATASGSNYGTGRGGDPVTLVRLEDDNGEPILAENGRPIYDAVAVTDVEATVLRRLHIQDMRDDLNAHCKGIVTMANNIARTTQQILGTRIETPRCSSTGRDGAIEWADPTCVSVPSRGPLCDRCAKAEYRWRVAHNMPARTDGLFTGDAA